MMELSILATSLNLRGGVVAAFETSRNMALYDSLALAAKSRLPHDRFLWEAK